MNSPTILLQSEDMAEDEADEPISEIRQAPPVASKYGSHFTSPGRGRR
jgi:hypothetical protein